MHVVTMYLCVSSYLSMESMLQLLGSLLTVVTGILVIAALQRRDGRKRLPPSPWGLPVIGHLHLLRPPVHRSFHDMAARQGPLMLLRLGSTLCVVVSSADVAGELIRSHEGKISERPLTTVARRFGYDPGPDGFAGFAFAPYGPHWRFMKRMCMSELLGPKTVEQLRPIRGAAVVSLLQSVLSSAAATKVDLTSGLIRLTTTSIIRMMDSTAPRSVTEEARALPKMVAELIGAFNVEDHVSVTRGWDLQGLGRRAADVLGGFDAVLEDMIRHKEKARNDRRTSSSESVISVDLLDILLDKMEAETAATAAGEVKKLTREKIKAFCLDIFTAGSDTSAAMMEWMLAELLNHPEALRKVREEIDAVVGRDRIVDEGDVASLPYLRAAYKEALRLHPGAPIAHRRSTEEMLLSGGFTVPAGTTVLFNVWSIGRDPAYWDAPAEYRPERFMDMDNQGLDPRGQHFHYLPFGSGRRACPGMGLVLQFSPAVVAALLQCFNWEVNSTIIDMEEGQGLVGARKKPLLLSASPRLNPFPQLINSN